MQGRVSTKDLIGDLRQKQGLPPADAALDQLAVQQTTTVVNHPAVNAQLLPNTVIHPISASTVTVHTLTQNLLPTAQAPYDLSVESSEAHTTAENPQGTAVASAVAAGQPVMPQSALLELVSNPLYAKSLDASRTTSTSPTRLDTSALVRAAEPQAESSELLMDSSLVQVSDEPILPEPGISQAPAEPTAAVQETQLHFSEQRLTASQEVNHEAAVRTGSGTNGTVVGQVSDQPILSVGTADHEGTVNQVSSQPLLSPEAAEVVVVAEPVSVSVRAPEAVLQRSDQPILVPVTAAQPETGHAATSVTETPLLRSEAGAPQLSSEPMLTVARPIQDSPSRQAMQQPAMISHQSTDTTTVMLSGTDAGNVVAVSNEPILSQAAGSTTAVLAEHVPVMSSQPMLGPPQAESSSSLPGLQQTLVSVAEPQQQVRELQVPQTCQRHAEPVPVMSSQPVLSTSGAQADPRQLLDQPQAESVAAMSSIPVLASVMSRIESRSRQNTLVTSHQSQLQTRELHNAQQAEAQEPIAVPTVPTKQQDDSAQGLVVRPPMPALPSVRRSRSDLRNSLQSQPSSVRRSVSVLPAVTEAPQPAQRSSPVPQLRRSVTSLQAAPVPMFDQSLLVSKTEPQPAAAQQGPVMVPAPFMPQVPLGPLQQGMPAPSQTQAHDRSWVQPMPSASVVAAPPMPVVPLAAAVSLQPVQVVVNSAAMEAQQSRAPLVETQLQQSPPMLVQESRSFELSPRQSPEAVPADQAAPMLVEVEQSVGPLAQQQEPFITQSLEQRSPQVIYSMSPHQQQAPVFMTSIDAGSLQQAAPPPIPMPAPRAYSPTQFLRSNTWSPAPGALQPAQPGQAMAAQQVHGPLSMGVQPSWNHLAPPQAPSAMPSQLAIEQEAYARAQPIASAAAAAQQASASRQFSPVPVQVSRAMYQQPDLGKQQQALVSRPLYQQVSLPSPATLHAAGAASREMYPQLGPLSSGVTQPGFPVRRELYQQVSLPSSAAMHAAANSREVYPQFGPLSGGLSQQTAPGRQLYHQMSLSSASPMQGVTAREGTVIQPRQGPVVVGHQSTAVTTQPLVMQSQGYSIQPLHSAAMQQSPMNTNAGRASGQAQMQFGALQQTGGVHAKRALEAFGRASRSSLNADASVNNSYQSDRGVQQVCLPTMPSGSVLTKQTFSLGKDGVLITERNHFRSWLVDMKVRFPGHAVSLLLSLLPSHGSIRPMPQHHVTAWMRSTPSVQLRSQGLLTHEDLMQSLQGYPNEPQPAQRAESPPTPAVPPVSYFLQTEPVVTNYITPLPQPVPMPGPPAYSVVPLQAQVYPAQGEAAAVSSCGCCCSL